MSTMNFLFSFFSTTVFLFLLSSNAQAFITLGNEKASIEKLPQVNEGNVRVYFARQYIDHIINYEKSVREGQTLNAIGLGNSKGHEKVRVLSMYGFDNNSLQILAQMKSRSINQVNFTRAFYKEFKFNQSYNLGSSNILRGLPAVISGKTRYSTRQGVFGEDGWIDILAFGKRYKELNGQLVYIESETVQDDGSDAVDIDKLPDLVEGGLTHLRLRQEDALFCENLRNESVTIDRKLKKKDVANIIKKIERYSKEFLPPKLKLRSSPLFDLACEAIVFSSPLPEISDSLKNKFKQRKKKISKKFAQFDSNEDENPIIYIERLR